MSRNKIGPKRKAVDFVHELLLRPKFRASSYFWRLQGYCGYLPVEEVVHTSLDFLSQSGVSGDYLEFGVYQGYTFSLVYHFAQARAMDSMRFYAFDSFAGLPSANELGEADFGEFRPGQFASDIKNFRRNLIKKRVDLNKVHIIPGWYSETLNNDTKGALRITGAAMIWIDCDLYESTVPVLEFITDYLQDGTIVVFDDWFCMRGDPKRGEQRAFSEWLVKNPAWQAQEYRRYAWHGMAFTMHRRDDMSSQEAAEDAAMERDGRGATR